MTSFQLQALVTFIAPFLIQIAKASQTKVLGWINENNKMVSVAISFVTSLATNTGIALHHTAGQLTLTYPDLPHVIQGLTGFIVMTVTQFLAQGAVYDQLARRFFPTPEAKRAAALTKIYQQK
jgi:hypothetical protein